jgi:hypothetical protein
VTLHSLRDRALYVTPIRIVLGVVWLVAARLADAPATGALLAFAGGAFATVFSLYNDPRSRFLHRPAPQAAPPDARVAAPVRQALAATLPSTTGVSVLAAVALAFEPVLAAFLGGISAGLGLGGALYALRTDPALHIDPKSGVVYRR